MKDRKVSESIQTNAQKVKPQYLTFLMMLYVTLTLVGCPVLFKIVKIGFINAPGGILPLPFVLLLEDIIAEVYGYRISRTLLWYLLFSMLLFIFSVVFIINLPSPAYWTGEAAYQQVFGSLETGVPIMVFGIFCGRFLNLYAITKLKILVKGRYFWLRSIFACLVGDIVALSIIYGVDFWDKPFAIKAHLFLSDLFVRVSYSIVGGGVGLLVVSYLKKKEGIDVYDYHTNFNPFSLSLKD
ncbi:MAG: uncharacterized protein K0S08_754 [Gammaproteobacteria bacterium]|jgi:uncharacterized PurR-regulated membrane protein YhhQ (DUF165 family)|nr:uncharacterized protein [Gammaproteobacteria bacterium]